MKVLWATTTAALCALSAGATTAPLLDVERSDVVSIVVVTPSTEVPDGPAGAELPEIIVETEIGEDAMTTAPQDDCSAVGGSSDTTAPTTDSVVGEPTQC